MEDVDWLLDGIDDDDNFMKKHGLDTEAIEFSPEEIIVNEVRLRKEDVELSMALKTWEVFPDNIKSAIWEIAHRPDPLVINTMIAFVHTDIMQEVARGTVAPHAHLGLVTGKDALITAKEDDTDLDTVRRLMDVLADDYVNPDAVINVHTVGGKVMKRISNKSIIETHFVQSMLLSASRLSRDKSNHKARFFDLEVGMPTEVSFEDFLLVQDRFVVEPDMRNGLTAHVLERPDLTIKLQSVLRDYFDKTPILKTAFDETSYKNWVEFLNLMDEERPHYSQLLLALACPKIVPFLIHSYVPSQPLMDIDCDLLFTALSVLDDAEADRLPPDKDLNTSLMYNVSQLNAYYTPELLAHNFYVKSDTASNVGYGEFIMRGEEAYGESIKKITEMVVSVKSGFPEDKFQTLRLLSANLVRVSEVLRLIRAQDDQARDDSSNHAADLYVGDYEQFYYQKWRKSADLPIKDSYNVILIGENTSFPYLQYVVGKDKIKKVGTNYMTDEKYDSMGSVYFVDLVTDVFDSVYDKTVPTRFAKTWMKAFPSVPAITLIFVCFSWIMRLKAKRASTDTKNLHFFLKLPFPSSFALLRIYCLIPLAMNMKYTFMLPKKSHDPYFYLKLTSSEDAPYDSEEFFLTKMQALTVHFTAGVMERHKAWEKKITTDQMRLFRARQWMNVGYFPKSSTFFTPTQREYSLIIQIRQKVANRKKKEIDHHKVRIALNNVASTLYAQERDFFTKFQKSKAANAFYGN